jgi:hypothetical protein
MVSHGNTAVTCVMEEQWKSTVNLSNFPLGLGSPFLRRIGPFKVLEPNLSHE